MQELEDKFSIKASIEEFYVLYYYKNGANKGCGWGRNILNDGVKSGVRSKKYPAFGSRAGVKACEMVQYKSWTLEFAL